MKKALITGITGQDGSYLVELLLEKGYDVFGIIHNTNPSNLWRINHLLDRVKLFSGDVTDSDFLNETLYSVQPDEVYNLAAQSFVGLSWEYPVKTVDITATGVLKLLEAIRLCCPKARFYQASSSEIFGKAQEIPQTENTRLYPRSPYGVAKAFGHHITINYRESYGMFAVSGILFNHESPRRSEEFVTRKITLAAAKIANGQQDKLTLGNLTIKRDWGHAKDYVRAMWAMLQQDDPQDYVIATGRSHSLEDFCRIAFAKAGLDYKKYVEIDKQLFRPADIDIVVGNSGKARVNLNWKEEYPFEDIIEEMVVADIERVQKNQNHTIKV